MRNLGLGVDSHEIEYHFLFDLLTLGVFGQDQDPLGFSSLLGTFSGNVARLSAKEAGSSLLEALLFLRCKLVLLVLIDGVQIHRGRSNSSDFGFLPSGVVVEWQSLLLEAVAIGDDIEPISNFHCSV